MNQNVIFSAATLLLGAAGAWMDWKYHKIPNWLTVSGFLAGLALRGILQGIPGLALSGAGFLTGSLYILLWLLGGLKAGDVKLYMAMGAIGGWRFCLNTELYSVLFGGAAALVRTIFRKNGLRSLKRLGTYWINMLMTRRFFIYQGEEDSYFPFGIYIAAGAAAAVFAPIL